MNWHLISKHIEQATGNAFKIISAQALSGGDINAAYHLKSADQSYFIKLNSSDLITMFEAEFVGLQEIAYTDTIAVPHPIVYGKTDHQAFLVLEYIEFSRASKVSDKLLGQQLALLHQKCQGYYGWSRNNTIGITLQINTPQQNWQSFWRDNRLVFQLNLAVKNGYDGRLQTLGEQLCNDMAALFAGHAVQASLLHGDLWAGNAAVDKQGQPVIFDPACYYGDREADIAMTELFGGFSDDFYASYQQVWPLDEGYKTRKNLYNLYHILNHLNMFGGGYLKQAENIMAQLIAEIR
ncbi:fructosamine kinase family protein [Crenothrix sp.]|uniref:fructosamine kinase family protein n=1 Tax=Crenothrix sp. TaxID=3100433 RepID=UPI00374D4BA9